MADFEDWLSNRLNALKVDGEVFSCYIRGILEGDEKDNEKVESIEGILESASSETADVAGITQEIIRMYNKQSGDGISSEKTGTPKESDSEPRAETFEDKVRTIFSQQTAKAIESASKRKVLSSEENAKLRSTILNQYAEVEDLGAESAEVDTIKPSVEQGTIPVLGLKEKRRTSQPVADPLLAKNTNAQQVLEAEKLKREKSKQESEAKKAKDKLDRENQKKKDVERKEKEKQRTQKGERRR